MTYTLPSLPTNIDATFPDRSPGDAEHQQHHDAIHGAFATLNANGSVVTPAVDADPTSAFRVQQDARQSALRVGLLCVPTGTPTANVAKVQADLNTATTAGVPLVLQGAFSVNATVNVPAGAFVNARSATVTQTADLTPIFTAATIDTFTLDGGTFIGKTTDYVDNVSDNTGAMFAASVIRATSSKDIRVRNVNAFGFGGPLLYATSCSNVWVSDSVIIGVGLGGGYGTIVWVSGGSKNNAGLIFDGPSTRVWVNNLVISYTAQGVLGGTNNEFHLDGLKLYDIGGQHGVYLNNTTGLHVHNIRGARLGGNLVKAQLSTAGNGDVVGTVIGDVIGANLGGNVVHLTATATSGTDKFRRVTIHDVIGTDVGEGVVVQGCDALNVHDVTITRAVGTGLRLDDVTNAAYSKIQTTDTGQEGVRVNGNILATPTPGSRVRGSDITIRQPGQAAVGSSQFGFSTNNCEHVSLDNVRVSDANLLANVTTSWASTTAYIVGARVKTSASKVLECLVAGTSSSAEPSPSTINTQATDGTVTWIYRVAAMRYGFYVAGSTGAGQASFRVRNMVVTDATDYGARVASGAIGEWHNNSVSGGLGAFYAALTGSGWAEAVGLLTKTASYTLGLSDTLVIFNGATLTATLPDPTTVPPDGRIYRVKNIASSSLSVVSAGTSKTIDGAASVTLAQWAGGRYVSNGTQWLIV